MRNNADQTEPRQKADQILKAATTVAAEGRKALSRLVQVVLGDSEQSAVVLRWLASVYNGCEAAPVTLGEIRGLPWSLREDLLAVVLGCEQDGFNHGEIRQAFATSGGHAAVDRFDATMGRATSIAALVRVLWVLRSRPQDTVYFRTFFRAARDVRGISLSPYGASVSIEDVGLVCDALFGASQHDDNAASVRSALAYLTEDLLLVTRGRALRRCDVERFRAHAAGNAPLSALVRVLDCFQSSGIVAASLSAFLSFAYSVGDKAHDDTTNTDIAVVLDGILGRGPTDPVDSQAFGLMVGKFIDTD